MHVSFGATDTGGTRHLGSYKVDWLFISRHTAYGGFFLKRCSQYLTLYPRVVIGDSLLDLALQNPPPKKKEHEAIVETIFNCKQVPNYDVLYLCDAPDAACRTSYHTVRKDIYSLLQEKGRQKQ